MFTDPGHLAAEIKHKTGLNQIAACGQVYLWRLTGVCEMTGNTGVE